MFAAAVCVCAAAVLQESDALQGELKLLQAERSSLSREVALKQQLEAGWAARAGQQAAALKEAQAKAATLEQSLQQVPKLYCPARG
jgi:septal ring factor EnvC (AmiA/AmiB activator)